MNIRISNTYNLKWQIKTATNYKFTKDGICINTKTGRIIKKTLCGGSVGYCINGKFNSYVSLRSQLELISKVINCPF